MNKLTKKLNNLVRNGSLASFSLNETDSEGNIGQKSDCRNSEILTLNFSNGHSLELGMACSGVNEDTVFILCEK